MQQYIIGLMHLCSNELIQNSNTQWSNALRNQCIKTPPSPIHEFNNAWMHQCRNALMHQYINALMNQLIFSILFVIIFSYYDINLCVLMYWCLNVLCTKVIMHQSIHVLSQKCNNSLIHQYVYAKMHQYTNALIHCYMHSQA